MSLKLSEPEKFLLQNYSKYYELYQIEGEINAKIKGVFEGLEADFRDQGWWDDRLRFYLGGDRFGIWSPEWTAQKKSVEDYNKTAGIWFQNCCVEDIFLPAASQKPYFNVWTSRLSSDKCPLASLNQKLQKISKFNWGIRKKLDLPTCAVAYRFEPSKGWLKAFDDADLLRNQLLT